jgi:Transposase, Mutator family
MATRTPPSRRRGRGRDSRSPGQRGRDLSEFDVCYLFLDSLYESLRRYGAKEGILAAWAITTDGRKVLLHLGWETRNPRRAGPSSQGHGLPGLAHPPLSVTSDGAPGLLNAIAQVFPASLRIRCWYHKMANIRAKLSVDDAPEVEGGPALGWEQLQGSERSNGSEQPRPSWRAVSTLTGRA